MIRLQAEHLDDIKHIGQETYPHECCGLLVGSTENGVKTVTRLIPAVNQRTDSPANRYLITANFLNQVETELRGSDSGILGFFHSHPDVPAEPSDYDREHAWPWYSYLIVSIRKGQAKELLNWRLRDDRTGFDEEPLEIYGTR